MDVAHTRKRVGAEIIRLKAAKFTKNAPRVAFIFGMVAIHAIEQGKFRRLNIGV
jgi:hypothetical protein